MENADTNSALEKQELVPPDPARVARRALALSQVCCRGFIERDAERAREFWDRAMAWFGRLEIDDELEPKESAVLAVPLGKLEVQESVNAAWRCEGLVVLAWALGRRELPRIGEQVVAAEVANSLGFLKPKEETVLHRPTLRADSALSLYADVCFAAHWRLREQSLRPKKLDFRKFAREAWFGPLSVEGLEFVENDLGILGTPVFALDEAAFRSALSLAQERHQAANWLLGDAQLYSEVDTST